MIWIAIIIVITVILLRRKFSSVAAGPTGRRWNVLNNFHNNAEAAALLASVNAKMIELMRHLKKKYHIDETEEDITKCAQHNKVVALPNDLYRIVDHMLDNYNPDVFYENDPRGTTETSYTVNKGAAMHICLRRKDDPTKLVEEGQLLFVMLHEGSHIANYAGWGHERGFWQTFAFILNEARLAGIYVPVDYSKYPFNYCGLVVNYNPLFDPALPKIYA